MLSQFERKSNISVGFWIAHRGKQIFSCKVWFFHGGDYEECSLLGCYAVWLL
jgi:hypothetical protein